MRDVCFGLGLVFASLVVASTARADQTAAPALTGFANYITGVCQNGQCPSLKITATTLYQNDHARYCVISVVAHDLEGRNTGPVPAPTVLAGRSQQYRSEAMWTYGQIIAAAGASPPSPPRIELGSYPFSPLNQPQCDLKITVQTGAMTIGSVEGSNEPTASFDLRLVGAMLVGVQTTSSNGGGGTTPIVIEKTMTPFNGPIR